MTAWTDKEVILFCQENGVTRETLTFFLTHFNEQIDRTIWKALKVCHFPAGEDTVRDIGLEIIEKLVGTDLLQKILDADNPAGYFAIAVRNHTFDWVQKQRTNRNAPRRHARQGMSSLSDPAYPESATTMEDIIPDPSAAFSDEDQDGINAVVDAIWEDIDHLHDHHRIVLQVALMECRPLSPETINEIARLRQVDVDTVCREVSAMAEDLDRRRQAREKEASQALQLHAEILLLQKKLYAMTRNPGTGEDDIRALEEKIAKKQATRRKHLESRDKSLRPPSREIARLLGLPEDQVQNINTMLSRVRNLLKEKYNNNDNPEGPEH